MIGLHRNSPGITTADTVKQRPRANATAATTAKAPQRCAGLSPHGGVPVYLAQPAAQHAALSLTATPQKFGTAQDNPDFKQIRQQTMQVFKALDECETNACNRFGTAKNGNQATSTADKREADIRSAYKNWRDSPADLSPADREKFSKKFAYGGQKIFRQILKENPNFERHIDPISQGFRDVNTGLYCELRLANTDMDKPEYVLCFPGTGAAAMDRRQWSNNLDQAIGTGEVPPAYKQAAELTELIKATLKTIDPNARLSLAGHSMGGGIANYVGLKHDLSSVCYNAAPLGGACLRDLGSISADKLKTQLHIRCKGDLVSSPKVQQKLQSFMQLWTEEKVWVPRNAGTICEVGREYAPEIGGHARHLLSVFDNLYNPLSVPAKLNINLLQMA